MKAFEHLGKRVVYKGSIVDFCKEKLRLPNGNVVDWDLVDHKGAAAVVAVREDGKIVMVRQYRPALRRFTLEIPAGGLNEGEETKQAAERELEEETGYRCKKIELLHHLQTTVAFTNERIDTFWATDLEKTEQQLDEDEFVQIEYYTIEELMDMIFDGTIEDGKTIAGLMIYKNKICDKR